MTDISQLDFLSQHPTTSGEAAFEFVRIRTPLTEMNLQLAAKSLRDMAEELGRGLTPEKSYLQLFFEDADPYAAKPVLALILRPLHTVFDTN